MRTRPTSGPWTWEEGQPKIFREWNGQQFCVASVEESRLGWHESRISENDEMGANARLIAAAPTLLSTLEHLEDVLKKSHVVVKGHVDLKDGVLEVLRNAIARAEGRSTPSHSEGV
jgi:hypothetical protein